MRLAHTAIICAAMIVTAAQGAAAEGHGGPAAQHPSAATAPSPYAGLDNRRVKALSDQQINDLRTGQGMGLALPAELNGYPGPRHALDLADELQLSDNQRAATEALIHAMKTEAISIGERIIADETELDRLFSEKRATPASVNAITTRIGVAQGELRVAHLGYHLRMMDILQPAQIGRYMAARGYDAASHRNAGGH